MAISWRGAFLLVAVSLAGACGEQEADTPSELPAVAYDTATMRIASGRDTVPLQIELAISPEQQRMGLMERRALDERAGMLFVYDSTQPPEGGFWMYRTRIPLDIAFADSAGVIRAVRQMVPCETTIPEGCPVYTADVPYRYALEVNAGFFSRTGMGVGDRMLLQDLPTSLQP